MARRSGARRSTGCPTSAPTARPPGSVRARRAERSGLSGARRTESLEPLIAFGPRRSAVAMLLRTRGAPPPGAGGDPPQDDSRGPARTQKSTCQL